MLALSMTVLASLVVRSRSKVGLWSFWSWSVFFDSTDVGLWRNLSCAGVADEEVLVVLPALRSREVLPFGVASRPAWRDLEDLLNLLEPEDLDLSLWSLRWLSSLGLLLLLDFLGDLDLLLFFCDLERLRFLETAEDDESLRRRRVSCAGVWVASFFFDGPGDGDFVAGGAFSEDWSVLGDASFLLSFSRRSAGGDLRRKDLFRFLCR